jgi:hypothetical protein
MADEAKRTEIQQVFQASVVNGAPYPGDHLRENYFPFPRETWLQKRLEQVRKEQSHDTQTN